MAKQYYLRAPSGEVFSSEHPEFHKDCENLGSGAKGKAARAEYCKAELRALLTPGAKVYCILRTVSASGMARAISLYVKSEGDMRSIDSLSADALGYKLAKKEGLQVSGCGMDMGFHLVYALSCALWPNGTETPPGVRNGAPDTAGGYALKHVWL